MVDGVQVVEQLLDTRLLRLTPAVHALLALLELGAQLRRVALLATIIAQGLMRVN